MDEVKVAVKELIDLYLPANALFIFSKILGYAVVAGAMIVKLPQIYKIYKAKSARGISLTSQLQELFCYTVTLAYNIVAQNPFSTWGESLFIAIQSMAVVAFVLHFTQQSGKVLLVLGLFVGFFAILVSGQVPWNIMQWLQLAGIPVLAVSRLIQIVTIFSERSTGELSFVTSFLNFGGSAARIFTTLQEVEDKVILYGFLSGAFFNAIIVLQFFIFWNSKSAPAVNKDKKTAISSSPAKTASNQNTPKKKKLNAKAE